MEIVESNGRVKVSIFSVTNNVTLKDYNFGTPWVKIATRNNIAVVQDFILYFVLRIFALFTLLEN